MLISIDFENYFVACCNLLLPETKAKLTIIFGINTDLKFSRIAAILLVFSQTLTGFFLRLLYTVFFSCSVFFQNIASSRTFLRQELKGASEAVEVTIAYQISL
jgi:hypothetical protein